MKFESTSNRDSTARLERSIERRLSELPDELRAPWDTRFENAQDDELAAIDNELHAYLEKRDDALLSIEFPGQLNPELAAEIKDFDRNVILSFRDASLFQGNGATAEVYEILGHPGMCVKFIVNQERYNENNSIRTEFRFLSGAHGLHVGRVRTPTPYFLRIHPKEGHSFGMEKVNGRSLSQILERPTNNQELIALAKTIDRDAVLKEITQFVQQLHDSGTTHNDLFKRNIMLDRNGDFFIIDFGKAKREETEAQRHMHREDDLVLVESEIRDFFAKIDKLS